MSQRFRECIATLFEHNRGDAIRSTAVGTLQAGAGTANGLGAYHRMRSDGRSQWNVTSSPSNLRVCYSFVIEDTAELAPEKVTNTLGGCSLITVEYHRGRETSFFPLLVDVVPKLFGFTFQAALDAVQVAAKKLVV